MILRIALALVASMLLALPAHANLLTNGSFELWSGGISNLSSQPDRVFNDGSLSVPGWNFAIGLSSDLYRDLNASGALSQYYSAADGDYLAGCGSFFTLHEGISQTFAVAPDTWHLVSFEMAPGGLNYNGSWIENATIGSSWHVNVTGAVQGTVSHNYNSNLANFNASGTTNPLAWTPKSFLFKSDSVGGNVTLAFTAFGDMTHIFLDDVVVTRAEVPEPATPLYLLTAALAFIGRKRKRARSV